MNNEAITPAVSVAYNMEPTRRRRGELSDPSSASRMRRGTMRDASKTDG